MNVRFKSRADVRSASGLILTNYLLTQGGNESRCPTLNLPQRGHRRLVTLASSPTARYGYNLVVTIRSLRSGVLQQQIWRTLMFKGADTPSTPRPAVVAP